VILKASAGGGGRGIEIVYKESGLDFALQKVRAEAGAAFGNTEIFLERYLENPRHIEVQILGDKHGNILNLGERDCTIQRKNQKLLEEAPSPILPDSTRMKLFDAAERLSKAINYHSVGTVEFLYDRKTDEFFFMEMNTRIQVEHPVTEFITGTDLIREMILISTGEKTSLSDKITFSGHSIECRINAEDPEYFTPSPGMITDLNLPGGPGVRIDTHIYNQYIVPHHYDSMIGKIIVHDKDRKHAISRMRRALKEFIVTGIKTNIPFHERLLSNKNFINSDFDTNFVKNL